MKIYKISNYKQEQMQFKQSTSEHLFSHINKLGEFLFSSVNI